MKMIIAVQARNGSTRLLNKSMYPIDNKPIIWHIFNNIKKIQEEWGKLLKIELGLCTTREDEDSVLVEHAKMFHVRKIIRGKPLHLWEQFYDISRPYDFVMRVCGDQPFVNIKMAGELLKMVYINNSDYDYYGWSTAKGIPVIQTDMGITTEIIKTKSFNTRVQLNGKYMEHVTSCFYENKKYKSKFIEIPKAITDAKINLSLDYRQDWLKLNKIYTELRGRTQNLPSLMEWFLVNKTNINIRSKKPYKGLKHMGVSWEHI